MRWCKMVSGLACLLLCGSCGMTVHEPENVSDPVSVFIADHGVHSSLLLPREDGKIAQYAYSQWHWAALDHDDWYRSPFAMVIPNTGTLGWRDFEGPCDCDCVRDRLQKLGREPPMQELYEVRVERTEARRVLAQLDARWASQSGGSVFNEKRGMTFVRDATSYSLANTCNQEVAEWLKEMGCRVTGMAKTADITVRTAKGPAKRSTVMKAGEAVPPGAGKF